MTSAIALKSEIQGNLSDKFKNKEVPRLQELVHKSLNAAGITTVSPETYDGFKAFTQLVDFEQIYVDNLNQLLINKWSNTSESWRIWVNNYSLTDFRDTTLTAAGIVREPPEIPENGEYEYTKVIGEHTSVRLKTYGDIIALDRPTIVNDDISAVNTAISSISQAYDRSIGNKVYNLLKDNPVMFGNKEIFHADHNNIVTAIGDIQGGLLIALDLMTKQTIQTGNKETDQERVHILPKYVIVPPLYTKEASIAVDEYNRGIVEQQRLVVISEPRLSGYEGWFLACDNPFGSIGLFTLQGRLVPEIVTHSPFSRDGLDVKYRFDYDVKPVDYRGLVSISFLA